MIFRSEDEGSIVFRNVASLHGTARQKTSTCNSEPHA